jgi:outer membrane protein assembly factor BamB
VIVATENNTVYSLDLFTGDVVWKANLGAPVDATTLPCGNIAPVSGITATPAADVAGGRLYVATFQRSHRHVLFALNLTDGSVAWSQDIDPAGSTPAVEQLRGALAIGSGNVYVPFGGLFGDCGPFRGYIVGVPLDGGAARSFTVPSARGASIWSPQGVSVGRDGSVYAVTGNAVSDDASSLGLSDSVVQLPADLATVRSYFAPSNWASLNAGDTDLGSVGATLLPDGRVFSIGKEGVAYLLRAGALGGIGGQLASRKVCSGAWGGTAWSGDLVYVPCIDGLFAVRFGDSSLTVAWRAPHPTLGSPIVSAGAVWALEPSSGTLFAFDPTSGKALYTTHLANAMHFSTPAATDGFVVVPAGRAVYSVQVAG